MTYEFNASDNLANDFPNPFKIENIFLGIAAFVLASGAVYVLINARGYLAVHQDKIAAFAIAIAMILFGTAVKFGIQALSQIRFYMSRRYPSGLARQLLPNGEGMTKQAQHLMEVVRQRAIEFPEPEGPLNGLLYSLIRPLVTSPPPIQSAAVQHFHSLLAMVGILVSMSISFVLFEGTAHEGVVSWFYLPMTGLSLLTPFSRSQPGSDTPPVSNANRMLWKLVGLIVFSAISPVMIPRMLPAFGVPPMWIAPLLLLIGSMMSSVLFLLSLFSQLDNVTQTGVSCEQTTVSMNCHPKQLWPKIKRDFQSTWVNSIPNRAYANVPPDMSVAERGGFHGEILEETQPTTSMTMGVDSIKELLGAKYLRYLTGLSAWGLILSVVTVLAAQYCTTRLADMAHFEISRSVLVVVALSTANVLAFRIGHLLWSRLYFKSRLIWIEVDGTYQSAEMRIGNQFTGNAQSRAKLTRVEDATLRVWVTDIVTVAFGKDGARYIMAMAPVDHVAKSLADTLKEFAIEQSSVAAPTSTRDFQKAQAISMLDMAMGAQGDSSMLAIAQGRLGHSVQQGVTGAMKGRVKFYDEARRFGFITGADGVDRFFNANYVQGKTVGKGDPVTFVAGVNTRGPVASQVCIA